MKNVMIVFVMSLFMFFVGCGSEGNSVSAGVETENSEDINTVSEKDSVVAFLNSVSEDKKDTIDADTLVGEDFTVVMNMIAVKSRAPAEGIRVSTDTVFVIDTVVVYDTIYVDKEITSTKAMPETKEESPSKNEKIEIYDDDDDKVDSGEAEAGITVELEIGECVETEFGAACADPGVEGGR